MKIFYCKHIDFLSCSFLWILYSEHICGYQFLWHKKKCLIIYSVKSKFRRYFFLFSLHRESGENYNTAKWVRLQYLLYSCHNFEIITCFSAKLGETTDVPGVHVFQDSSSTGTGCTVDVGFTPSPDGGGTRQLCFQPKCVAEFV